MRSPPFLRAGLTMGAQSLSSITNFAVVALALSAGSLGDFGRFAITFQLCVVVVVVGQASIGDLVMIHTSRRRGATDTNDLRDGAAAIALVVGAIASVFFAASAVVFADFRTPLLLAALGAPALVAQYTMRARRFADDDPAGVVVADLIWLAVVLVAAGFDLAGWDATPDGYLAAWLLGAAVSAAPAILVGLTTGRRHIRLFWDTAGPQMIRLAADGLLARSIYVVSLIAADIVIGSAASGALAAAVLVFSPLSVIHTASSALVVPREISRRGIHVVRTRVPVLVAAGVTAITVAWAITLWLVDVTGIGFGPFDLAPNGVTGWLFVGTFVRFLALAIWRGPLIGLRIADAAGESLRVRVVATAAQWVLPVVGLLVADIEGGAAGLAVGTLVGAGEAWRMFLGLEPATGSDDRTGPRGEGLTE